MNVDQEMLDSPGSNATDSEYFGSEYSDLDFSGSDWSGPEYSGSECLGLQSLWRSYASSHSTGSDVTGSEHSCSHSSGPSMHRPVTPVIPELLLRTNSAIMALFPPNMLKIAISKLLRTDIAQVTLAEIVDGIPLADTFRESYLHDSQVPNHPIYQHTELSKDSRDIVQKLSDEIHQQISDLFSYMKFDKEKLLSQIERFHWTPEVYPGRLLEFVAGAVHHIAIKAFRSRVQKDRANAITSWTAPAENSVWWEHHPRGAPPTLLYHSQYRDYDQYPNGIADGVGYWAQSRILGGVFLKDIKPMIHNESHVYLHPDRSGGDHKIFGLFQKQLASVADFLEDGSFPFKIPSPTQITNEDSLLHMYNNCPPKHEAPMPQLDKIERDGIGNDLMKMAEKAKSMPALEEVDSRSASQEDGPISTSDETQAAPKLADTKLTPPICPFPILRSKDQPTRSNPLRPVNLTTIYGEPCVTDPDDDEPGLRPERFEYDLSNFVAVEEFFCSGSDPAQIGEKPPPCSSKEERFLSWIEDNEMFSRAEDECMPSWMNDERLPSWLKDGWMPSKMEDEPGSPRSETPL